MVFGIVTFAQLVLEKQIMKLSDLFSINIFILSLILFLTESATAQRVEDWNADKYRITIYLPIFKQEIIGQSNTEISIDSWKNNNWERVAQKLYMYDSAGNTTGEETKIMEDNKMVSKLRHEYTFLNDGKTYEHIEYHDQHPSLKEIYIYDSAGRHRETQFFLSQKHYSSPQFWERSTDYFFSYDSQGNRSYDEGYYLDSGKWVLESKSSMKYKAKLLTEVSVRFLKKGHWRNNNQTIIDFDSNDNVVSRIYQRGNDSTDDWVNINRWSNTLDKNGNLLENMGYEWKNTSWQPFTKSIYSYDEAGRLIGQMDSKQEKEIWREEKKYSFLYSSSDGKLSEFSIQKKDENGNWANYQRYTYIFTPWNNSSKNQIVGYVLLNNFPNPFNPTTNISYTIPKSGRVSLKIYDILGKEVSTLVDEQQEPGTHTVTWNAQNLASGAYFYRLVAGDYVKARKMMLVK